MLHDKYRFVTRWQFDAPVEAVWKIIADAEKLPDWWEGFLYARVRGDDKMAQVGRVTDCAVRGTLPWALRCSLEITDIQAPNRMVMRANGDLVGTGEWILIPTGFDTMVAFIWEVCLTHPVLAALGRLPFVRRLLEKSHHVVMARGYRSLQKMLESPSKEMRISYSSAAAGR